MCAVEKLVLRMFVVNFTNFKGKIEIVGML